MTTEITKANTDGESSIYQTTESFEFAQRQAKSLQIQNSCQHNEKNKR